VLTRQALPTLDRSTYAPADGVRRGAYVLADLGLKDAVTEPQVILMASGSEVSLIVEAGRRLAEKGVAVRLVSFPSWELFAEQDAAYQDAVLPPHIAARVSVEAGVSQGWHRWVGSRGQVFSLDRFGASAPGATVFKELGFTVDNVVKAAMSALA